ncbi:unnamed protein product [Schistosoma turkestanicum]|nr:unnamed protein product [Schistosoma turkestanicum]
MSISDRSVNEVDEYLYLDVAHSLPPQNQYSMRVGYPPGRVGTEQNTIIIPPESRERSKLHELYAYRNEYEQYFDTGQMRIQDFHFKFYQTLVKLHKLQLKTNEVNKLFYEYLIPDLSNARMQFIMYYCRALLDFTKYSIGDEYANTTRSSSDSDESFSLNVQYDIHQFCPKACAYRGGSGFSVKHKNELNRYSSLCSFPEHFMPIKSQRCIEQNNVALVNLQSFKCECSNGFIWKEQVKACYLPYGWRQKGERSMRMVNASRSDHFTYYAYNNCSRIGTKFIQPIEINSRISNHPNHDRLYHTESCFCKDEFYGTTCDQVYIFQIIDFLKLSYLHLYA